MASVAFEEGVFAESINFAALRSLPVLFVCENNQYSVYTHIASSAGSPSMECQLMRGSLIAVSRILVGSRS